LAYLAAFLIAGYLVCALIAAFRNMVNLRVAFTQCENAHAGESVSFQFALHTQRDRYFITLANTDAVIMVDRLRLGATPVRLSVPTHKRGLKRLGRVTIQSIAPTGLIRAFAYVHFSATAMVYPALLRPTPAFPHANASSANKPNAESSQMTASVQLGHGDVLDGVREYRAGDSFARVAWNAVARGHGWRTKLVAAELPHTRVLEWWHTQSAGDVDARLSTLATWVVESHRRGEAYCLVLPGLEVPTAQGQEQRTRCLIALANANV
jgi:uncharacterized protein (DUF58 family)